MRAVLDTNQLVSYLIFHRPPISTLIDEHLARDLTLVTAPVLLQEIERVLGYPRLQRYYSEATRRQFAALVAALAELVDLPPSVPRICCDAADDWLIACAIAGRAGAIVSSDRDVLALVRVGRIPILTAAQCLAQLEREARSGP